MNHTNNFAKIIINWLTLNPFFTRITTCQQGLDFCLKIYDVSKLTTTFVFLYIWTHVILMTCKSDLDSNFCANWSELQNRMLCFPFSAFCVLVFYWSHLVVTSRLFFAGVRHCFSSLPPASRPLWHEGWYCDSTTVLYEAPRWGLSVVLVDSPQLHARLSLPCFLLMW